MLNDNIESIELKFGTPDELLSKELSREARFLIESTDITIAHFKKYLAEFGEIIPPDEYLKITLRLISNITINTLVPFCRACELEDTDKTFKASINMLSQMIYAGFLALQAADESENAEKH